MSVLQPWHEFLVADSLNPIKRIYTPKDSHAEAMPYTILLIDDSAEDRAAYCRYLERGSTQPYQVLEANSAVMGLDLYQRLRPDAIVLDYLLPDMNGFEFLAAIPQTGKRVPVLLLTGQGDEFLAAQALKSGVQDYLIKGNLTAEGLCQALAQAIAQFELQQQLQQQAEQQQMLSAIALRIRQSLTLQTILDTSVEAIQQYLAVDRVLVYQFAPDMSGQIVAEAVLPGWTVSLHSQVEDTCFRENLGGDYQRGKTQAIADIHEAGLSDCHIKLLERFQVKANLVVPLLITEPHADSAEPQLWGLLVAHQCAATRQWQPLETELLQQVAVQMAIAIQQAELYQQLRQLNQTLETRVQERTAQLQRSETRLREAQRLAGLGHWEYDLTTQSITWSEELFRLFGRDAAQGEPAYAVHLQSYVPASRDQLEHAVQQAATLGTPYELELQFWRADGSVGWLLARGEAIRAVDGVIVKLRGTALEITARKQAEVALRESERRFATLAAAAPVGIFRFDVAVNCVYVNECWSAMTGRPVEAGLGEKWVDAIHPEDRERIAAEVAQWLQTCQAGDAYRNEARILRPDGSIVWFFCQMLPETDARGTITGYVGTLTDITERKQAEEALRNLSDRLTLAVKSGAIAIWDWNIPEDILTWDDRMYELYGTTPDAFTSVYEAWANSVHPDDRPLAEADILKALAGEKDYEHEFRVIHPDGTIHFIKAYALVQRNAQGEPQELIGINYDTTARKQAELEKQQLQARLQFVLASSPAVIFTCAPEGDYAATFISDNIQELVGYTPADFLSESGFWANHIHPEDAPRIFAGLASLFDQGHHTHEYRFLHKNGSYRWMWNGLRLVRDAEANVSEIVGYFVDITDRKQVEQALQQLTLDLQRSNQELEQFAYVASHDLQEPLRAITSYTQLLAKRYQGQLDAKADRYIDYVVDGAARMQQLIRDLLAYSRVGRYELKLRPTDCNAVLEQVKNDLQVAIAESNAVITVDALPTIPADAAQVTQLFQNLIGNALKYHGQAVPIIRISASQQGNEWSFSIQDNGIGIEPQYAERIFEIFQRLHTRREYEGTGLGLAICKKIVERHHGRLWVESQLGQGATFCFTLPASRHDEPS
ncbi:MAG: PAS domain-containing protein (plasmid) [Leptolyngbya sp. BL-A-14]